MGAHRRSRIVRLMLSATTAAIILATALGPIVSPGSAAKGTARHGHAQHQATERGTGNQHPQVASASTKRHTKNKKKGSHRSGHGHPGTIFNPPSPTAPSGHSYTETRTFTGACIAYPDPGGTDARWTWWNLSTPRRCRSRRSPRCPAAGRRSRPRGGSRRRATRRPCPGASGHPVWDQHRRHRPGNRQELLRRYANHELRGLRPYSADGMGAHDVGDVLVYQPNLPSRPHALSTRPVGHVSRPTRESKPPRPQPLPTFRHRPHGANPHTGCQGWAPDAHRRRAPWIPIALTPSRN